MSKRCLVHNKEMKYDKRSGFELCRLCEAELDPEPQEPQGKARSRAPSQGRTAMSDNKWIRALKLAQEINKHTGSCWNTGGTEICEKCLALARKLEKELR